MTGHSVLCQTREYGPRSSPVPGVVAYGETNHGENSIIMTRVICKFPAGPEVVVWDHGRKNKDNGMIIWHGVFLQLIMLNLLKERYALHAIQL